MTEKTNHTQGPWMFESEEGFCSMIISEDGDIVCQFDQDPKEADARLISVAPKLLEAAAFARDLAMRMIMKADIPYCAEFAAIAQELGAAIAEVEHPYRHQVSNPPKTGTSGRTRHDHRKG